MAFSHLFIYHSGLGVPPKSCGDEKRSFSLDTVCIFLARQSQVIPSQDRSEKCLGSMSSLSAQRGEDSTSHRTGAGGTSPGVVIASTHPWQLQYSLARVRARCPSH